MRADRARGFTLVELLVVIGVIALLMGLLAPALSKARKAAKQTQVCAGLRELLTGYTQYHIQNKGAVLMGYIPNTLNGWAVSVDDPVSGQTFGTPIANRYPWRLAPYVGNIWGIIHNHADVPPLPESGDSASVAFLKAYTLSINPSFGLNSVFVGGQKDYGGFIGDQPNSGKHVVFRASEVRQSSRLIVFAECQGRIGANAMFADASSGLHWLTPPRMGGQRWTVEGGKFVITRDGTDTGLPMGRFSDRAAVGFFDGHVDCLLPAELTDMRLWANLADREDYDIAL